MGGVRQLVKIGQTAGGLLCRRKSRHGGLFTVGLSERTARVCADGVQDGGEICFAEGAVRQQNNGVKQSDQHRAWGAFAHQDVRPSVLKHRAPPDGLSAKEESGKQVPGEKNDSSRGPDGSEKSGDGE